MRALTTMITLATAASFSPAIAGQASLTLLTTAGAYDVTVDEFGRTLVLTSTQGYITPTYIYEDGSYTYIGDSTSSAMSDDGRAVAGIINNIDGNIEAGRWTETGGWQGLGGLPSGTCDSFLSSGYGISGDGSIVVGLGWSGCNARSFNWTEATGMVEMAYLGNGNARASSISNDGTVAVGFTQGNFNRTPAVWDVTDGSASATYPFDPDAVGELWAVTPDGGTVAGRHNGPAFYWNEAEGIVSIGTLDDDGSAMAHDITPDATTIVGYSGTVFDGFDVFVWTAERGMEKLQDRLVELGVTIAPGVILQQASAVTPDGRTIVGYAFVPGSKPGEPGQNRAFIATLPDPEPLPCTPDLNGDETVGFADLTQLLNAWGPCPGCDEDLDNGGLVGFADLTIMLNAWGPCP